MSVKSKQWFIDRIGKRVYRNKSSCTCDECKTIVEDGLVIHDKQHAEHLYDIQNDFLPKYDLDYRDVL